MNNCYESSSNPILFLWGFMGSGKSYLGTRLANLSGRKFIDLDHFLEKEEGLSIQAIFEKGGERLFRQLEQKHLHTMADFPKTIIATGGGTPCFFDNATWMNQTGITVYIKVSPDILAQRLRKEKKHRPLIANLKENEILPFIRNKLTERSPFYQQAQFTFNCTTGAETADDLICFFKKKGLFS